MPRATALISVRRPPRLPKRIPRCHNSRGNNAFPGPCRAAIGRDIEAPAFATRDYVVAFEGSIPTAAGSSVRELTTQPLPDVQVVILLVLPPQTHNLPFWSTLTFAQDVGMFLVLSFVQLLPPVRRSPNALPFKRETTNMPWIYLPTEAPSDRTQQLCRAYLAH